jgi:hypothetical protein
MPRGISGLGMAASPLRQRPHLDRTLWPQQIGRQASPNPDTWLSGREASERGRFIRSPRQRGRASVGGMSRRAHLKEEAGSLPHAIGSESQ